MFRKKMPISEIFIILGQNSFFVYIGHYVLYVIIAGLFGLHQFSSIIIFFTVITCLGMFVTINRVFRKEVVVINRIFF
jgi:fucose 4-O-acetylase-like acetyltransferase